MPSMDGLVPGMHIWARDHEAAWTEATVLRQGEGRTLIVSIGDGVHGAGAERSISADDVQPRSRHQRAVADMDDMSEQNEATLLHNIAQLYAQKQMPNPGDGLNTIYTSVGPMLITMNPNEDRGLTGEQWHRAYSADTGDLGPHPYRTAKEALARMHVNGRQFIVICGESGAGKSVANGHILDFICHEAGTPVDGASPQQITNFNVLLEAFGNARTGRNPNSSRFGKVTRLSFNPSANYVIMAWRMDHYLLERSRVVRCPAHESTFHVFYKLSNSVNAKKYGLEAKAAGYRYTSNTTACSSSCDSVEFEQLVTRMAGAGISEEQRDHIFSLVAAVLHLGNVDFTGDQDSSTVDVSTLPALRSACGLLGVDSEKLGKALGSKQLMCEGKVIMSPVGVETARAQRDTVAKTVYARLFAHIVSLFGRTMNGQIDTRATEIGLLDMFGFEDFEKNSLEQLLINLTNERFQHLFNGIVFEREQRVYRDEGIKATFDPGMDSLECVRLLTSHSNPKGIIGLIGENISITSDDTTLVQLFNSRFGPRGTNPHTSYGVFHADDVTKVAKAKGLTAAGRSHLFSEWKKCFQVKHYACRVTYTVDGWLPKSIDALLPHLFKVLQESCNAQVAGLFAKEEATAGATVGEKFSKQLETLNEELEASECAFVRCIKPNSKMEPGLIDRPMVLAQLKCGGITSVLEMRHRGLPERMSYFAFSKEFGLLHTKGKRASDDRRSCEDLLKLIFGDKARASKYDFGKTMVFMKSEVKTFLCNAISLRNKNVALRYKRLWVRCARTVRIRMVSEARERVEAVERLAESHCITGLPKLAQELVAAKKTVDKMETWKREAMKTHGSDLAKVSADLPAEEVRALCGMVHSLETTVHKISKRKVDAEQSHGRQIVHARGVASGLMERIALVESACEEASHVVEPDDLHECRCSCTQARILLEGLQSKTLPELKRLGPQDMNLEAEEELHIDDKVSPLLDEMSEVVVRCEQFRNKVLLVRKRFLEAVAEQQSHQEEAELRLEKMLAQVRLFMSEGQHDVADAVSAAVFRKAEAQDVLRAAMDADGYRMAVRALCDALDTADIKMAEGEKRRALLLEIHSTEKRLTDAKSKLSNDKQYLRTTETQNLLLSVINLLREIPLPRCQMQTPIDELHSKVGKVLECAKEVSTKVKSHCERIERAQKDKYERTRGVFEHSKCSM